MYQGIAYDLAAVMPEAVSTGLFVSLCTIQMPTNQQTADGSPVNAWENVGGLVDIPCMDAPEADSRIRNKQEKSMPQVEAYQFRHVLLNGYYPVIAENANWRAMLDGTAWDIWAVESDSQQTQTRLLLQITTV